MLLPCLLQVLTPRLDNKSVMGFNLSYMFHKIKIYREAMDQMLKWVAENKLKPPAITAFSLDDISMAHRSLESGNTVGKLVLDTR